MMDQALVVKSARVRPATRAPRGMGRDSSRSVSPWALSSATATAIPPPVNSTIVAT